MFVVQAEDVEKSHALFASAVQHYEDAIKLLPEEERSKPIKQQQPGVCDSYLPGCKSDHCVPILLA